MAFVQENDGAGPEGGGDFCDDACRVVRHSVISRGRPTGESQSGVARGEVDKRIRHTDRSAKAARGDADRLANGFRALDDLAARAAWPGGPERGDGVREGVVLHQMPFVAHPAAQGGMGGGFFSDHIKLGTHSLAGQEIEDLRGLARIGAVVDRQAHLVAAGREVFFHRAEPLAVPHHTREYEHPAEKRSPEAVASHGCAASGRRKILSPSRPRRSR